MNYSITAGYITFAMEKYDWARDWKGFFADLKALIPADEREYDEENKTWHIKATPENQMHMRALKKRYFEDENQESLNLG